MKKNFFYQHFNGVTYLTKNYKYNGQELYILTKVFVNVHTKTASVSLMKAIIIHCVILSLVDLKIFYFNCFNLIRCKRKIIEEKKAP